MEELSIEEKARRFDEAIKEMKGMMFNWEHLAYNGKTFLQDLVYIFPELKESESEDEKIRKDIIDYLSTVDDKELISYESWIAWLGKQGEQKSADKVEPKFKAGDIVKSKSQPMLSPRKIISIGKDCYWCEDRGCIGFAWEDDYEIVEQNSAWSEEDKENLEGIICEIKANKNNAPDYDIATYDRFLSWLNSLKDRYTWKPSDEQMENLSRAVNGGFYRTSLLMELYQDLKKLREE